MKATKKKILTWGTIGILSLGILFNTACGEKGKNDPETTTKESITSVLQIIGFNDDVSVENNEPRFDVFLIYSFKNGNFVIDRLSREDYQNNVATSPLENNVGEFGLFSEGAVFSHGSDKIKSASITYSAYGFCDNNHINLPNYDVVKFFDPLQHEAPYVLLNKNLKLFEIIKDLHQQLAEKHPDACFSLDEFRANPASVLRRGEMSLKLDITLKYATKKGKSGSKQIRLNLKPALNLSI